MYAIGRGYTLESWAFMDTMYANALYEIQRVYGAYKKNPDGMRRISQYTVQYIPGANVLIYKNKQKRYGT